VSLDLTPCLGQTYRLRNLPLMGMFTVGKFYKVLRLHRSYFVVEDDKGSELPINFSRFDLSTTVKE
jgi:hypothetical protein